MTLPRGLLLLALVVPGSVVGAARARDGGVLSVAVLLEVASDATGETLEGATLRQLHAAPLCRLERDGRIEPVLASFQRTAEGLLITPRPGAHFASGPALSAAELVQSWQRGLARSPVVRAALAPLGNEPTAVLDPQARAAPGAPLLLPLVHPWPDLEATLCHPALAPELPRLEFPPDGIGPYASGRASLSFPTGRPHPDSLSVLPLARRAAIRALQQRTVQLVLGEPGETTGPALLATYLVHRPERPFAALVASRLDRVALVRSFVGGPSVPMPGLLPPALGGRESSGRTSQPNRPPSKAVLLYAKNRPSHRAVAERIQILLRDAGVQLTLSVRDAEALDAAWRNGEGDLALRSVLLPPLAAPALAVVLDLAEAYRIMHSELAALGELADPEQRATRARIRAIELAGTLPLTPLFAEAARVRLDPALVDARLDGFGVWVLDDAWWP